MYKSILAICLLLFVSSCGDSNSNSTSKIDKSLKDSIPEDITAPIKKDTILSKTAEVESVKAKIEEKYGEQWEFCDCIVRNDSITDAFEKKLTTAQEEKLMARWEYVDTKCKEITINPATTPEDRTKHERKVKKCLKANGLTK